MNKRSLSAAALLLSATPCFAGSSATNAKIIAMDTNKGYGANGLVFIKLDVTPSDKPECSHHYWDYTLSFSSPIDDKLYAALLAAFASGVLVTTTGTGFCTDYGYIEALRSVQVSN